MRTRTAKLRWDLDSIFPGGSASKEYETFRKALTDDIEKATKMLQSFPMHLDGESSAG
jgi:hypothetical protein